jgi:hypothetical protein
MPLDINRTPWRSWPMVCNDGVTRKMSKRKRILPNGDQLMTCTDDGSRWIVRITGSPHIAEPYVGDEVANLRTNPRLRVTESGSGRSIEGSME